MPPSREGYSKRPALPKTEIKPLGGQKGHQGNTLDLVASPDKQEVHGPTCCADCGRKFKAEEFELVSQDRRQVFDLPPVSIEVVEHRIAAVRCCGKLHKGVFPSTVKPGTQYGANIQALACMLVSRHNLSLSATCDLLKSSYKISLSEGTLVNILKRAHELLAPVEQSIKDRLSKAKLAHFDETGVRVAGKLVWLHVASNKELTYLFVHSKRGKEALDAVVSILPNFKGWAVHDCWKTYFSYEVCRHVLCNAHILRELQALKEQGSIWAAAMHNLLMEAYKASDSGLGKLQAKARQAYYKRYEAITTQALSEEPQPVAGARGRPKQSKGLNLAKRLISYKEAVLAFIRKKIVPFTNNEAERDLRPAKGKLKVAGCLRTWEGSLYYARFLSFYKTTQKQGQNTLEQLTRLFNGLEYNFALPSP